MWIDEHTHTHVYRKNDGVCVCCFLCLSHLTGVIAHTYIRLECSLSYLNFIVWRWLFVTAHTVIIIILTISFTALTTAREKFRPQRFIAFSRSPHFICLPADINEYPHTFDHCALWCIWIYVFQVPRDYLFIYIQTCVWVCEIMSIEIVNLSVAWLLLQFKLIFTLERSGLDAFIHVCVSVLYWASDTCLNETSNNDNPSVFNPLMA